MSRTKVSQESGLQEASVIPVNGSGGFDPDALGSVVPAKRPSVTTNFDMEEMRAPPGPDAPEGADFSNVSIGRPRRLEMVYVHPEWRYELYLIPADRQEPVYAVKPAVAESHLRICRKALIVPYADRDNRLSIWPVLLEDSTGTINKYSRSAIARIAQGAGRWCGYEANLDKQEYRLIVAEVQQEPPEWPPEGLPYMLQCAFEDRIINDPEHEMLRLRRGKLAP